MALAWAGVVEVGTVDAEEALFRRAMAGDCQA